MGILDIFKVNDYKNEVENLQTELSDLKNTLTPDLKDAIDIKASINTLEQQKADVESQINELQQEIVSLNTEIENKKGMLIELDEEILLQDFGVYKPRYQFTNADEYKRKLDTIRNEQKALIKNGHAANGDTGWTVNGNIAKGKKMVKDMQKLLLRAFNAECDDVISKVKYNNYDSSLKRLVSARDAISKLGEIMGVSISYSYFNSKKEELALALEYQMQKQKEKEEQKMLREQLREEAKLKKEIEEARKNIEKEQKHYTNALNKALDSLEAAKTDEEKAALQEKIEELNGSLEAINKNLADIDYREANKKAGYVYVISNIGSFGENVYKIGMTRRLDPMERVYELGDASVPFNFDVHAMIFSDDAPKLEAALHNAFADKKVNMINTRREFFNVTLDEIEQVVKDNYEKSAEFVRLADAEQYRLTLKLKEKNS